MDAWSIQITINNEDVLWMSDNELSGIEDIEKHRQQLIDIAKSILSFIGEEDSKSDFFLS